MGTFPGTFVKSLASFSSGPKTFTAVCVALRSCSLDADKDVDCSLRIKIQTSQVGVLVESCALLLFPSHLAAIPEPTPAAPSAPVVKAVRFDEQQNTVHDTHETYAYERAADFDPESSHAEWEGEEVSAWIAFQVIHTPK
jgi:hypothetical protein